MSEQFFEDLGVREHDPSDVPTTEDKGHLVLQHFESDLSATKIRPHN